MTSEDRTPGQRAVFLRDRIWSIMAMSLMAQRNEAIDKLVRDAEIAFEQAEKRGLRRGSQLTK